MITTVDLGELAGPILVFGGPYSNLAATQAIKDMAEQLEIPPHHVICTGDIAAYCAEPEETALLLQEWGIPVIQGNCEEMLGKDLSTCDCGFDQCGTCDHLTNSWYLYSLTHLSEISKAWMASLPNQIWFRLGGLQCLVVHAGIRENTRPLYPSASAKQLKQELKMTPADIVIAGHSGLPFCHKVNQQLWINAGAIGLPANDGTPDGWFALLTPTSDGLNTELRRLPYNADKTRQAMIRAGLTTGYHTAIASGLWPSLEQLPQKEKDGTGQALDESKCTWPLAYS